MITYTTKFPVNNSLTEDEFIRMVIKWNQGSPYDKIEGIEWNGQFQELYWEAEHISLELQRIEEEGIIASRLQKEDQYGIWTTDFILNLENQYMAVSVALVTTELTTDFSPTYLPPYFVKQVIYRGYAGWDSGLAVSQKPHSIVECEELMTKMARKEVRMMLPVVYITENKETYLDITDLAFRLQGVAHVVYEPNEYVRSEQIMVDELQNLSGKIIIFYPSSHKKIGVINYSGTENNSEWARNRIINDVYNYVNKRIRVSIDTWEGIINEQLHLQNLELIKGKISVEKENDSLYEEFGEQLKKMEDINEKLNNENQKLKAEIQGLRMKYSDKCQLPVLVSGEEKDFYDGEIREIILEILDEYRKNCREGSRRECVITDILESNEYLHLPEKRKQTLKKALKGYRTMNGSLKSELESLGIEITSDGKHYKWSYFGDNRYVATVSKTSSDVRAGMNMASTIEKLMF